MTDNLPPLPAGATLDNGIPPLPPGATLDHGGGGSASVPPLPAGATLDQPHKSLWDKTLNAAQGLQAQYQSAGLNGVFAQPVRYAMEHLDNPVTGGVEHAVGNLLGAPQMGTIDAQLKQQYPNYSQDQIDQLKHNVYGNAVTSARQQAQQNVQQHQYGNKFVEGVGNVASSLVANPQDLLLGGSGVGKSVAARIATGAALNSGIAAASDSAAQGMDILEGQQKDWDVKRSLENAALGGVLGGGMQGAHEAVSAFRPVVSDFVTDLFKNRGRDTTPSDTPTGDTSPLTGNQPTLSQADKVQLRGLMRDGSVDDIKNFLATKQGPKPSYQEVNNLVQFRDGLPEQFVNSENALPAIDEHIQTTRNQVVQDHLDQLTEGWKNKPDIQLHNSIDDIQDPKIKADVQAQLDRTGKMPPGFYGSDGQVHIFPDSIHSPAQTSALLYHEGLGHFGLQEKFGAGMDKTIDTLMAKNVGQFGKDVDAWQQKNPGAYGGDRTRAGEEVLAEMSEKGPLKQSLGDAISAHVRRFGRAMGMKLSYSDAEVGHILQMAHDAVINGKGRNVRSNMFGGKTPAVDQTKFMFTGPHATDFDPMNDTAFMTRNKDIRNEISDHEAFLRPMAEGTHKLGDVLDHPELFEQYPELADTDVHHYPMEGAHGGYEPNDRSIHINSNIDATDPLKLSTALHETQHAIQHIEGNIHEGEDNMNSDWDDYRRDPREIEANETERRKNFTPEARLTEFRAKFMDADRLSNIKPEDYAEEAYNRFDSAYKPKYRSWDEAIEAAKDSAVDYSEIKKTSGVGNLDRKMFVYEAAADAANKRLLELHAKDQTEGLTDEDKVELANTAAQFHYVLGRIDNDAGQIGRALNAMKQIKYSRGNIQAMQKALFEEGNPIAGLMDNENGSKFLQQFAALASGNNPNGASALLKQVSKPYWWQYALTWRNNMMLSALSTHLKSTMDMATTAGRELEEKLASLPAGAVRKMLIASGLKNVKPGTDVAEIANHAWGFSKAVLDAQTYKDAAAAFKSNSNAQRFGQNTISNPVFGGKAGAVVMLPTKMIAAQDSFFRDVLTNAHLYALGTREASLANPTMSFDNRMTAGAGIARNPSRAMVAEAQELAAQTMLMNRSPLNDALDKAKRIRPGMNGVEQFGSFITNYLTPFVRVQSNALMNQLIRRSPLSILDPQTRADWAAGGTRRDVAVARTLIGTAIMVNAWNAADPKNKKLTGTGPENLDKLKEMQASGWSPASVHENGQYSKNSNLNISLNPFDMHNNTASLVAGVREAYEAGSKPGQTTLGLKLAMTAVMHDLVSQTFVNDIGEAWDATSKTGETGLKKLQQFAGDEATSFLPNAGKQLAKVIDPAKRDTSGGIGSQIQASIPGLSQNLPAQQTVYGDDAQNGQGVTGIHTWLPQGNHITGGNHTDETTDPAEQEMARISGLSKKTIVGPVQRTIQGVDTSNFDPSQVNEEGHVRLTPEQFEHFQHVAGVQIKETMREEMSKPEWGQMSDEDKAQWLHQMALDQKKAVKEYLYGTR